MNHTMTRGMMLEVNVVGETARERKARRKRSEGCVAFSMDGANDVIHHDRPCRVAQEDLKADVDHKRRQIIGIRTIGYLSPQSGQCVQRDRA